MKTIFAIIALALFALTATAQVSAPVTVKTATITAGATSNYTAVIDCKHQENTGLQVDMKGDASNATLSNVVFTFSYSADGVTYGTDAGSRFTWTPAINGSNLVTSFTNVANLGAGKLKLVSIQNTSTNVAITNLTLQYLYRSPGIRR